MAHMYAAFKDGTVHQVNDEVLWRKDGTSFPVDYTSTPIWEDGQLAGAVVTFRDISTRK
jgi:PAS domain S-box-containing protein